MVSDGLPRHHKVLEGGLLYRRSVLKLRTSQSVNTLKNALYKHFKLSQLRNKIFTPFLDNLF